MPIIHGGISLMLVGMDAYNLVLVCTFCIYDSFAFLSDRMSDIQFHVHRCSVLSCVQTGGTVLFISSSSSQ